MKYSTLKYYVIFMRYKRSGSALLVNLLDSHPNIIFVRNEELFGKFSKWSADRIFDHLFNNSKRYKNKPFSANGYKYPIEGVGFVEEPFVIGHKSSTRNFIPMAQENGKLEQFQNTIRLPLKFVHLIRNPYNMISARWQQKEFRRVKAPLDSLIDHLYEQVEGNYLMRQKAVDYYQLHLEDLIRSPENVLGNLCDFLEVPTRSDHLDRCKKLIFDKDDVSEAPWTEGDKLKIKKLIELYPEFFNKYGG